MTVKLASVKGRTRGGAEASVREVLQYFLEKEGLIAVALVAVDEEGMTHTQFFSSTNLFELKGAVEYLSDRITLEGIEAG